MGKVKSPRKNGPSFIYAIYVLDVVTCVLILGMLFMALNQSYQGTIYSNESVEHLSLTSSFVGFLLAAGLIMKIGYFKSSLPGAYIFLRICFISGILHLICALALIFYFASSYGYLMIVLGHIYRDYGYLQLINAVFLLGMFLYFILYIRSSTRKQTA
jgi:hypothetical protein